MRLTTYFLFLGIINVFAQRVSGRVLDEERNALNNVLILNMKTTQRTYTDNKGEFTVSSELNEELRFIKSGFDRQSKIVTGSELNTALEISLRRNVAEIEEVLIKYQPTGDLAKDLKNVGDSKPVAKLKAETVKYIRSHSAPEVLAAKPGEFVQPVGPGFSVGKVNSQWDDFDFMEFLLTYLGTEFFSDDLKLAPSEFQPFVYYIFRNFPRTDILFYGRASTADISRFINESYKKLDHYRKNLPNEPPTKKKRR